MSIAIYIPDPIRLGKYINLGDIKPKKIQCKYCKSYNDYKYHCTQCGAPIIDLIDEYLYNNDEW